MGLICPILALALPCPVSTTSLPVLLSPKTDLAMPWSSSVIALAYPTMVVPWTSSLLDLSSPYLDFFSTLYGLALDLPYHGPSLSLPYP